MEPTQEQIDALYVQKVMAARQQTISEKLLEGPRLFALECETRRTEIRAQHPGASSADVERILREQLEAERLREEEGIYVDDPLPERKSI